MATPLLLTLIQGISPSHQLWPRFAKDTAHLTTMPAKKATATKKAAHLPKRLLPLLPAAAATPAKKAAVKKTIAKKPPAKKAAKKPPTKKAAKKATAKKTITKEAAVLSLLQVDRIGVKIAPSHLHSYSPPYPQAKDKDTRSFPITGAN